MFICNENYLTINEICQGIFSFVVRFCVLYKNIMLFLTNIELRDSMTTRFFRTYKMLCEKIGKSPNAVAKELSISSGSVTAWKNGRTPKMETISKIAEYFNVDEVIFFLSDGEKTHSEIVEDNIRAEAFDAGIEYANIMKKPHVPQDIGPNKQAVLDLIEDLDESEAALLLERIKKIKESRV